MNKIVFLLLFLIITGYLVYFIYNYDKKEREPISNLVRTFIVGFCLALAERLVFRWFFCKIFFLNDVLEFTLRINDEYNKYSDYLNYGSLNRVLFSSFFIGGICKVGLIFLGYRYVIGIFADDIGDKRHPFDTKEIKIDYFVYSLFLSLGFAFGDFAHHYFIQLKWLDFSEFISRNLLYAAVGIYFKHIICSIIIAHGFVINVSKNYTTSDKILKFIYSISHSNKALNIALFLILAMLTHAILNLLFLRKEWLFLIIGTVLILLLWKFMRILMRKLV